MNATDILTPGEAGELLATARAVLEAFGEFCMDEAELECVHRPMIRLARALDLIEERRLPTLPGIDAARPWHPLAIDPVTRRVTLDGVTVPDGALLELSSEGGPILARLCLASEGGVWARVDLFALGDHDRIPVALRLYSGAIARFAHAAEGRRD